MRHSTIILMVIAVTSSIAIASLLPATGHPLRRSRFLAGNGHGNGNGPKNNKKCSIDPSVCNGTQACCKNSCVDLQTDSANCGHCGMFCKFTYSCCDGKCVHLSDDKRNCGRCNNHCEKVAECLFGLCSYA